MKMRYPKMQSMKRSSGMETRKMLNFFLKCLEDKHPLPRDKRRQGQEQEQLKF